MEIEFLKSDILKIIEQSTTSEEAMFDVCTYLKDAVSYYDWVGFYFKNGSKNELKLGPFAGEPTEHTIIPFGKGICGQVALSNSNFVVQDVNEQENYISCGWKVKSEIVIPLFKDGENIGQIDIDSHEISPFSKEDERLLEFVCNKISAIL